MRSSWFLFLVLFVFFTFPALSDEGESALTELERYTREGVFGPLPLIMEFPYGSSIALRVGGPIFNMLRNDIRLAADAGEELTPAAQAILRVDEISGVDTNSVLIVETTGENAKIFLVTHPTLTEIWNNWHGWHGSAPRALMVCLFEISTGWIEVVLEDGVLYAGGLPLEYSTRQPFLEIMNSFRSDSPLLERFENSGVAIFDAASGMAYAGADIWGQLSEGEIVRSVKALLRIPLSGVQLGGTVAMKVLRLPFDLAVTGIQSLIEFFSEEEHDIHHEVRTKILDNNDYSLEIENTRPRELITRPLSDFLGGIYRNTSITSLKEGIQAHFERGMGRLVMLEQYFAPIEFQWTAVHDDEIDFFVARVTDLRPVDDGRPVDEGRNFIFMGTIDGIFDIDIEGVIIQSDMSIREVLRRGPRAETLREFREQALGTFHFDDD